MREKQKYVYIFGAGASFNTHPLINQFFESMEEVLETADRGSFERFEILLQKIRSFGTPDSYAKHLFQQGLVDENRNEYELVKEMYSVWVDFFTWSDLYPGVAMIAKERGSRFLSKSGQTRIGDGLVVVDERYIELFEKIGGNAISNNSYFTWNYDRSIEYTLAELGHSAVVKDIVHLNGRGKNAADHGSIPEIRFHWEEQPGELIVPEASSYAFVGYSFPEENWSMDMKFFEKARCLNAKVIIQNPDSAVFKRLEQKLEEGIKMSVETSVRKFIY